MEDSKVDKTRSRINAWDDARILAHVANISRTQDLDHLRLSNADAMTIRPYNKRNFMDTENDNNGNNYYGNNIGKAPLDYQRWSGDTLPYSIDTMHLRNFYKQPQRLEDFILRDNSKGMYSSQDFVLRSRHNNLFTKKEPIANKNNDQENEKIERSKKKKHRKFIECGDLLKQYCENTSFHGLRYVGDSTLSTTERVFWLISFIIALMVALYYITYLYKKWIDSPIIIALSPEPVAYNQFPFPSVTICNMNNIKKTEAIRIERGSNAMDKSMMEDLCNIQSNNITYTDSENIEWAEIEHFMINVSQPCSDMLYHCSWRGNETDCTRIFNSIMTDEGICCNFNSVDRKYLLYNPRDWADLNISYPAVSVDWNAETGYTSNMPKDVTPQRSHGIGLSYGLSLVLDVEIDEYYCSSTDSAGFKMLLHSPVETPKIADFSFAIKPGEETRLIVRPQISVANPKIIYIPLKKRKCFFSSERKLHYYRTYTQRNCINECQSNFTQRMCSCVEYYMPKSAKTPICGKKDNQCALLAKRTMELKLYDEELSNTFNVSKISGCNCLPACFEINYRIELSQSKLLSNFNHYYLKKDINYFMKNMAVVHLFFVDSQFTQYIKNELFGFTEFLSSTGGLLGLFLGFSFLSLLEVLYFLTLRMWCRIYRRRETTKLSVQPIHPLDYNKRVIYPFAN